MSNATKYLQEEHKSTTEEYHEYEYIIKKYIPSLSYKTRGIYLDGIRDNKNYLTKHQLDSFNNFIISSFFSPANFFFIIIAESLFNLFKYRGDAYNIPNGISSIYIESIL